MKTFALFTATTAFIFFGLLGCTGGAAGNFWLAHGNNTPSAATEATPHKADKTMRAFASEEELKTYFRALAEKQRHESRRIALYAPAPQAVPQASMALKEKSSAGMEAAMVNEDSVTNVQQAGVDEGGIVKVHGDHLVVLRRGRLFTIAIGGGALDPISSVDAFAPDIDPHSTWYDEMLVSDNTVAVIGYSYERGGTEVGLFHIDSSGRLSYQSTYHLRSNDYYSSRNYASRLIGSKLIFYSPLYFYPGAEDPYQSFPAVRKWHKGASPSEFRRIVSATHVYRPDHEFASTNSSALHTVTVCDLARGDFDCHATSVIGPPGRVFYVSAESVYVWVNGWQSENDQMRPQSMVYRMPLDGSAPTALNVSGSPVDQFSFLESEDGYLNVLVRSDTTGDGMWGAEAAAGSVALLRIPLASFSDGSATVPPFNYHQLPTPRGYTFQNRFVGDYLLYGTGNGWGYPEQTKRTSLYAVRWDRGDTRELSLPHGVDRIEEMGSDAVVVGTDGSDLHFTAIRLGNSPEVANEFIRKGASQSELRSQGFFYKPEGRDSGMLGLPISTPARPGYAHLFQNSAAVLFLRNDALHFHEVGELEAQPERTKDDGCRASCVDWYGNARPLFVHGRVIALLGYELVEGTLDDGRMQELRRVSYAPQNMTASRAQDQWEPLIKK